MVKTIAVSVITYRELVKMREELDASSMDDMLDKLMVNYRRMLKQASIKGLFSLNKKDRGLTTKRLLDDRGRYGWARKLY